MISKFAPANPLIYGIAPPPLVSCLGGQVQPALVPALESLAQAAQDAGFAPAIASGYRDFSRQLAIFNAKARGERALLDSLGAPLVAKVLAPDALLAAILRWSALPGASRHHWGTDFDIYDTSVCTAGYRLALTVAECEGVMAPFHAWLNEYLSSQSAFARPYEQDQGGVAPEPWHLSYTPLAEPYSQQFNCAELHAVLAQADIALKDEVLAALPGLVARYVV
ncbi:M15 family metallopeptidase [Simiduia sp. 21SJ11W-1]|uniref:M15 family metallopeptidase n=1 Tax=Simiduia sp. 21SJ11W-1 TaxID=2909669 RepID=UPI00209F6F2D|nr:M15 family metallopeptidase [Simiduia sp. 21SJ11W-1]UTA48675.1 M15 family metallopeptidase [Simiduia sp. 21SJ11W-1]